MQDPTETYLQLNFLASLPVGRIGQTEVLQLQEKNVQKSDKSERSANRQFGRICICLDFFLQNYHARRDSALTFFIIVSSNIKDLTIRLFFSSFSSSSQNHQRSPCPPPHHHRHHHHHYHLRQSGEVNIKLMSRMPLSHNSWRELVCKQLQILLLLKVKIPRYIFYISFHFKSRNTAI